MKRLSFIILLISFCATTFAINPVKVMSKIDRISKKADKCKCLSKTQEIDGASVKFYFTKSKKLVKIIEKRLVDGVTVFRYFYFDKKSGNLISVNLVGTIFYYYDSDYFAVISRDNFSEEEAERRGLSLKETVENYIKKIE